MSTRLLASSNLTLLPRLLVGALLASPAVAGGANGLTDRVSRAADGSQAQLSSNSPAISADGQHVAFVTHEALIPEDLNGVEDVYVLDRQTGVLRCASRSFQNYFGNGPSKQPSISADGRFVAFTTAATNLAGILDQNGADDVVVKDLLLNTTKLVSGRNLSIVAANAASRRPAISGSGRFVAFESQADDMIAGDGNGTWDIYVRDLELDTMWIASWGLNGQGNAPSREPSISDDGTRVAFHSDATNLTLAPDANASYDVFVHFQEYGACLLVSRRQGGDQGNSDSYSARIAANGSRVAFISRASNLFAGDTNGVEDYFYSEVDPTSAGAELASVGLGGEVGDDVSTIGAISGDGNSVVFQSLAHNLTADGAAYGAVYLRDLALGKTYLVSRPKGSSTLPNSYSRFPVVNYDGSEVAFESAASNLDQGDTNGYVDIFVRTLFPDPTIYCEAKLTSSGCVPQIGFFGVPSVSVDSGFVVSVSNVPNQKPGMLFYGFSGRNDVPYLGGTLCVKSVAGRSPVLHSAGTPPPVKDCSGSMEIDLNAFAAGTLGGHPLPGLALVGQRVNVQFWGRDPGSYPDPVYLSDALEYVVGP